MLTDSLCKSATCPTDKPHKRFSDSGGMYLEVTLAGGKYWRLKYRLANKEKRLALGVYPATSLKMARLKRDEAKVLIGQGQDPSAVQKMNCCQFRSTTKESFSIVNHCSNMG
jgi:hypothetical protein